MMVCDTTVILVATEPFTLVDAVVRVSLVEACVQRMLRAPIWLLLG